MRYSTRQPLQGALAPSEQKDDDDSLVLELKIARHDVVGEGMTVQETDAAFNVPRSNVTIFVGPDCDDLCWSGP